MQFENLNQFYQFHKDNLSDQQRFGQRFCNTFIKGAWPELFHERDESKAYAIIAEWLETHCYFDTMPQIIPRVE